MENENKNKFGLSLSGWLKLIGTIVAAIVAALTAQSCGVVNF